MKKINYSIEYNSTTKIWVVWKNIENDYSFNSYSVFESTDKKECKNKLNEINKG